MTQRYRQQVGSVVHLVERGAALPALPQTRGLQALEDSREGTAGPLSPRAGVTARPRHAATYRHTQLIPNDGNREKQAKIFLFPLYSPTSETDEIHLFSWARHSSGHTLWPPCLWGTSVGICSWNKRGTPPAQRDRMQRRFTNHSFQFQWAIFDLLKFDLKGETNINSLTE